MLLYILSLLILKKSHINEFRDSFSYRQVNRDYFPQNKLFHKLNKTYTNKKTINVYLNFWIYFNSQNILYKVRIYINKEKKKNKKNQHENYMYLLN